MENKENREQSGKKKSSKVFYWVLIGVFAAIFLVSGTVVVNRLVNSYQHNQKLDVVQSIKNLHTRPTRPIRPSTSSDPSGTEPSATQPSGTDPVVPPTTNNGETTPTDPIVPPTRPEPTDPNPTDPKPTDPQPTDPQPTEPKPTKPNPPTPTVPTKPPYVEPVILEAMLPIYQLNQDVVGWIAIPNMPNPNLSKEGYPVMQKPDDPDFYLYRDFFGEDDPHGCIYAEEHADVFGPSDVVTLHGHHMGDGTMFHDLKNFKSKNFFDSHKVVYFDTLYHYREYEVVMVLQCNGSPSKVYPYFAYHAYKNFKTEAGFNNYVESIRALAIQGKDAELKYGDKLLLLSTCDYGTYPDGRMVVVCKLVAEY